MPQTETPGSESPEAERVDEEAAPQDGVSGDEESTGGEEGGGDAAMGDGLIDPSNQEIPTEPLPGPAVRITIIPGRETDEDVEPGEEVPNVEVDVTTEPR